MAQAVEAWRARADPKGVIDYGLHVSVTDVREDILSEMEDVVRHGVSSLKCYLAYPERLRDDELLQVLRRAKDTGALVNVHCENGWLVDFMTRKLLAEGNTEPRWHPRSRPAAFEEETTQLPEGYDQATLNNGLLARSGVALHRFVVSEPMGLVPYELLYDSQGQMSPASRYDDPGPFEHRPNTVCPWRDDHTGIEKGHQLRWGDHEKLVYVQLHNRLVELIAAVFPASVRSSSCLGTARPMVMNTVWPQQSCATHKEVNCE